MKVHDKFVCFNIYYTDHLLLDDFCSLRMHLCADEYINVSVDTRTGRITLRDTGSLSASGRAARYSLITDRINENPAMVCDVLVQARFSVRFSVILSFHYWFNVRSDYYRARGTKGTIYGSSDFQDTQSLS